MFFTAINQMMTEGVDLTLVIRKANGQLAVSTLPKSNGLKDEAQNHIVPLTVNGKPEELDAGFLQTVARPIQKAVGLITNMAQFEVQAEKAASESKAAKDAKAKETKEEKERREKYEKHLKKAEELIAAKKSVDEIRDYIGADSLAFLSLDGLVESIGLGADAPYGGLCVAYFNGDYPTALDDYEADFLKSLTPEDRVRLPEFALYKSKYEGNEYTTTSSQEEH